MEDKREIVRSSRPRLSERKVVATAKDEGNTASMSRLETDTRPKQNIQNLRRWIKVLRAILRSKMLHTLQEAVDRIQIVSAARYGKQHLIAYRLKKLFSHVVADQKGAAFRRTLLTASIRFKKESQLTLQAKQTFVSKATIALFSLLDTKMKGNQRSVLFRLAANRKVHKKVYQFARSSKVNSLANLQKARMLAALLRIQGAATSRKTRIIFVKIFKSLEVKSNTSKQYAFGRIRRKVLEIKQVAANEQAVAAEKPVEQPVAEPTPQKPAVVDRKLQAAVTKLQNETSTMKQKLERQLENKQRKQKELEAKLEVLAQQNQQLASATSINSKRALSPTKPNQPKQQLQPVPLPKSHVYENIFTNLLFFLKNSDESIPKEKVLENLLIPMSRVDMPIETLRMENEVLEEVLQHYRKLKLKLPPRQQRPPWYENKPYEYLLKQNRELYDTLKELTETVDPSKYSKGLEQLIRDFEALQKQIASRSPSKA